MIATADGTTGRAEFAALAAEHRVVPVVRELFADGETPVGIYRKLAAGGPGTFLLESAEQGGICLAITANFMPGSTISCPYIALPVVMSTMSLMRTLPLPM